MKIYRVGGAVRDALLGLPVSDQDWVVVGATPEQLVALGYLPVGKDFPVFLHPQTREEYALARTERKSGRGYHGFTFHADAQVTLEQDLARRDLTINAIAQEPSATGSTSLIDPYGGQQDLAAKVLRHVSPAFAEDPVRILRLARFAARFSDFTVAPETMQLMRQMVVQGEVDALVAERVWQELARGLMERHPTRMFAVLQECGALKRLLPEKQLGSDPNCLAHQAIAALDVCAAADAPLPVRVACLLSDLAPHERAQLCQRLRVPQDCRELVRLVASQRPAIANALSLDAAALLDLLERCDALRRGERFTLALLACECLARATGTLGVSSRPQSERLMLALCAASAVATAPIAAQAAAKGSSGVQIGALIAQAHVQAIATALAATTG